MLRNTVNIVLSVTLAIFIVPSTALADWYWITELSAPDTGYFIEEISPNTIGYTPTETPNPLANKTPVPDSFMDTMDKTKSSEKCFDELDNAIQKLRQFDASEEVVIMDDCRGDCGPYFVNPQATLDARERLLEELEEDAQSCLVDEQQEIQDAIEEQERKEAEEARIATIEDAVANCDLDFFDTMTTKEKMDTYDEREACKVQSQVEEAVDPEPVEVTPVPAPPVPPVETPVLPVTPITQTNITPTPPPAPEPTAEPEAETESVANTDEASSTPDVIEEENTTDTQQYREENPEPEPAPRPSFFQRIINFFTSWF